MPRLRAPSRTRNGKVAVSGNQAPATGNIFVRRGQGCPYLVKPRSADSINRINVKTSSECERVPRIFSSACVVLSFERSRRRKAFSMDSMRSGENPWRDKTYGVHAIALRAARRRDFRKRRHVLRDHGVRGNVSMLAQRGRIDARAKNCRWSRSLRSPHGRQASLR